MRVPWKLALGALIVAGVTGYMAYLGASSSWQYYLSVDECLTHGSDIAGDRVRVSGPVGRQTLRVSDDRREIRFFLEGKSGRLPVVCSGPPPDNLAEGIEVVVEGRLDSSGCLRGDRLLTRCASKYKARGADDTATAAAPKPERRG